jgi:hypothetical protein
MNKLAQLIAIPLIFSALTTTAFADFQFTFDGHTYQVITTSSSWEAASAAARSKTVNGVQGYLAHIDNLQPVHLMVVVQHMFGLVQMIYQLKEHGFG